MARSLVEKDVAQEIIALHNRIIENMKQSLQDAIKIGGLLTKQKTSLEHGRFIPWVRDNLPFTDRTARNYMRLYRERDRLKTETVSDLNSAYKLLAAPANDVEEQNKESNHFCDDAIFQWAFAVACHWESEQIEEIFESINTDIDVPDLAIEPYNIDELCWVRRSRKDNPDYRITSKESLLLAWWYEFAAFCRHMLLLINLGAPLHPGMINIADWIIEGFYQSEEEVAQVA